MTIYQCRYSNNKNTEATDLKRACLNFNCEFKKSMGHCGKCEGPIEIDLEQLIDNAKDNIVYEDDECTTTINNNVAICPYCGAEIDMSDYYDIEEGKTFEVECPVCEKDIEVELYDITYCYSAHKTD